MRVFLKYKIRFGRSYVATAMDMVTTYLYVVGQ